jgi:hypothetical protein
MGKVIPQLAPPNPLSQRARARDEGFGFCDTTVVFTVLIFLFM